MTDKNPWMTVAECHAEVAPRVNLPAIYRAITEKRLKAERFGPRSTLVRRSEWVKFKVALAKESK